MALAHTDGRTAGTAGPQRGVVVAATLGRAGGLHAARRTSMVVVERKWEVVALDSSRGRRHWRTKRKLEKGTINVLKMYNNNLRVGKGLALYHREQNAHVFFLTFNIKIDS